MKKNTVWPQLRLSWWIVIGVAAIVLITTLLMLTVVDQFSRNYARHEAEVRLKQLAWQMRDAVNQSMQQRIAGVKDLAQNQGGLARNVADPAALRTILTQAKNQFNDYAWIGVAAPDGKVIASAQPAPALEGGNANQRAWFVGGQKELYVGDYRPLSGLKQTLPFAAQPMRFIDVGVPLLDQKGGYKGVLGAHLRWDWTRDIAAGLLNPANNRYSVDILVVRDDGIVLLGPKALEGKKLASGSLDLSRKGAPGATIETMDGSGVRYITGYANTGAGGIGNTGNTGGLNWSVLVRQPEHLALADILVLEKQMLIVATLEVLLLMVCAVLLSYKLVAPMNALSASLEARALPEDAYVATGWNFYEFSRLSSAIGGLPKHGSAHAANEASPNDVFLQRVNERVRLVKATVAGLPKSPATELHQKI